MPSALPSGEPAPLSGALPESVAIGAANRTFSVYVHVPYCRVRCGYCDFNTYTASELRGTSQREYADLVRQELRLAARAMQEAKVPGRPVSTVFFGGGTPTLLPTRDLAKILAEIRTLWGLTTNAEITTEANPDSVTGPSVHQLAQAGFTRLSVGMQSAVPEVLATLERTHDPSRVPQVAKWAREHDLQFSLDLIYGTPGESARDWECSLNAALELEPDHLSAYALIVEPGTKLAAQIRRGEIAQVDDDLQAEFYERADRAFASAGYSWYELSNWSRSPDTRSRHNLAYWTGGDWWAAGPGAHSHLGGTRWWNVKHPAAYAGRIGAGQSPAHARELLSDDARYEERVMLETRLAWGMEISALREPGRAAIGHLIASELIDGVAALRGRLQLTLRGRLLADQVVRALLT